MTDVRKVLTDAGYVSIGLGVLGYQQAQTRRRDLRGRLESAGECVAERARGLQTRADEARDELDERTKALRDQVQSRLHEARERALSRRGEVRDQVRARLDERTKDVREMLDNRTREVRDRVEEQTRVAIDRFQELGGELGKRVEPLVDRLPEPVAKAVEPVRARVRALAGSAA